MKLFELSKKIREKFGDRIDRIILFGSYARGDYNADSDIDLLLIVNDTNIEYELRKFIYSFIPCLGRLISVKVINSKDYKRMKKNEFILYSIHRERWCYYWMK